MITEFWTLLTTISNYHLDNRKSIVEEHIMAYEKSWNTFSSAIQRANLTSNNRFGKVLIHLSKSNKVKTKFLLKSLPIYYINTIKHIQSKDYSYDNTTRKLGEYITRKKVVKKEETIGNHVVLKEEVKGMRYTYCKSKG